MQQANKQTTIKAISTKNIEEFFTKLQLEMIEDALEKTNKIVANHNYHVLTEVNYDLLDVNDPRKKIIENYRESNKALTKISRMINELEESQ